MNSKIKKLDFTIIYKLTHKPHTFLKKNKKKKLKTKTKNLKQTTQNESRQDNWNFLHKR